MINTNDCVELITQARFGRDAVHTDTTIGYLYSSNRFMKCGSQANTDRAWNFGSTCLFFIEKNFRDQSRFPELYRNYRYALISRAV